MPWVKGLILLEKRCCRNKERDKEEVIVCMDRIQTILAQVTSNLILIYSVEALFMFHVVFACRFLNQILKKCLYCPSCNCYFSKFGGTSYF